MNMLVGKRALVTGVANKRSIAWGLAHTMAQHGAEICLSYQNDKLKERVAKLSHECNCSLLLPCDVSDDEQIKCLFDRLRQHWSAIDIVVHCLAYAPRDALQGSLHDNTSREAFRQAHDISSYSLIALAHAAQPLMSEKASLLTLSYLGAERVVPGYNVMGLAKASLEASVRYLAAALGPAGIRCNAISAGPVKTLAAAGIRNFRRMLEHAKNRSPLKRTVTIEELGQVGAFLCSDLASGITGETIYVDAGYHIMDQGISVDDGNEQSAGRDEGAS